MSLLYPFLNVKSQEQNELEIFMNSELSLERLKEYEA